MNTVPSHMLEGAMRIDVFARFYEDVAREQSPNPWR